jgi:hypothetical protein
MSPQIQTTRGKQTNIGIETSKHGDFREALSTLYIAWPKLCPSVSWACVGLGKTTYRQVAGTVVRRSNTWPLPVLGYTVTYCFQSTDITACDAGVTEWEELVQRLCVSTHDITANAMTK